MKKMTLMLMMLLVATFVNAKEVKTLVVTITPQMHCANCENRVKTNLQKVEGIVKVEASAETQRVAIDYDAAQTSEAGIIGAMKKLGYEAVNVKNMKCEGTSCEKKDKQHECSHQQGDKHDCGHCEEAK